MATIAAPPRAAAATRVRRSRARAMIGAALAALLVGGVALLPEAATRLQPRLQLFATIFLGIFIEALPFLLLGVLASAAIQLLVSPAWLRRLSPRSAPLAALTGATLGLFCLPVCECGTVPATRRLLAKGAPLPLGIAFLLAAPAVNPVVIASTWIAFNGHPLIVFGRLGLTILIATIVAIVLGNHPHPEEVIAPLAHLDPHDHGDAGRGRVARLCLHAGDEFFEMGRYLVAGAAAAALFQTIVPREALLSLGQGPVVSVLVLMALATILSICSTVDAFVALAFANHFLPGALLAFLVFGPMIDLKSVLLFTTTFRRRTVLILVVLVAQLAILAGVAINLVVG